MSRNYRHWAFLAAAAIPCVALLIFCGVGIHEWWLISTHQIAVIPSPTPGTTSAPEVPAARLLPLIFGSGALAAVFAYAFLRSSRTALIGAYLAVCLLLGVTYVRRVAAEPGTATCPPGEPIQWVADYCMATIGTDDEIAASDCIAKENAATFKNECAAKLHFKRALCETVMKNGSRKGTVELCVRDPAFMGSTVRNGGIGGQQ